MTQYRIKVTSQQKNEGVVLLKDGRLAVFVGAKREQGEANDRAVALLAQYLKITAERITIVSGHTRSTKTVRISEKR